MILQDSEVEMPGRVSALETAIDDAVHLGLPRNLPICRTISFFAPTLMCSVQNLLDGPPAPVEPMTVLFQPGARAVLATPRASPPAKAAWLHDHMANLERAGIVFRNPQTI